MNKEQTDQMAGYLLREEKETGRSLTAKEAKERLNGKFSASQQERVFKRYRYLSLAAKGKQGN